MAIKDKAEALSQQRYTSSVLKNLKDFFSDLIDKNFSKTLTVKVDNLNTKLEKEVAENTRGVKGRLDKLIKKTVDLSSVEDKLDYITESVNKRLDTIAKKKFKVDRVAVGEVSVSNFPEQQKEIRVSNLKDIKFPKQEKQQKIDFSSLETVLNDLKSSFNSVNDYLPNLKQKAFPKITIPKTISVKESQDIINSIQTLQKTLSDDLVAMAKVIQAQESGMGTNERGEVEVKVSNFPPQHIPTPVTNININSLRGLPKSSVVTISSTASVLPNEALAQRRSMIIYNESGETLYIGGSDVTTANGFPVLDQSYSPPIDAGEHMKIYGIMASGGDVRVLEVSNDSEGN